MRVKTALSVLPLLALCACSAARLDIIQVGPWFPARNWRDVEVVPAREAIRVPWGGIGIIHGPRVSAETGSSEIERMKLQARKEAAAMGADAVIIAVDSAVAGPQMGVYQEPEIFVSALAVKYVTATSTSSAK